MVSTTALNKKCPYVFLNVGYNIYYGTYTDCTSFIETIQQYPNYYHFDLSLHFRHDLLQISGESRSLLPYVLPKKKSLNFLPVSLKVAGMCACLQDSSVLVQRSMLDFLLLAFPLHNGQLTKADMSKVVEAGVNVVLRRDMSLNRRLCLASGHFYHSHNGHSRRLSQAQKRQLFDSQ
ncbi:hypothetical protein Btru_059413 [Bulinus truncatus]|nr:hypothetical protein Btru_059413 [Bulinus truncatus]